MHPPYQTSRISCPLDSPTVTIDRCGQCFRLLRSTLLDGDRAARGRSLFRLKKGKHSQKKEITFAKPSHNVEGAYLFKNVGSRVVVCVA